MLQFITHPNEKYTIVEEAKMAIDGGCKWVQIRMKQATDDEISEITNELIPLCKEKGVILILNDRVELCKTLGVHGVHIGKNDMNPIQAREFLGAEAIIGVTANTAEDIISLKGIDVDYVGLGPFRHTNTKENLSPIIGLEGYKEIITKVRTAGINLPIVAIGGITIDDIEDIMNCGVNGIAMSGSIINSENPTQYTTEILQKLYK